MGIAEIMIFFAYDQEKQMVGWGMWGLSERELLPKRFGANRIYSVNCNILMTPNIEKKDALGFYNLCDDWKKIDLTWAEWYLPILE